MPEPTIEGAVISAGHDGQAELVVHVRYENGGVGSVTLDAEAAEKLMQSCRAETVHELRGQPWQRLLDVLPQEGDARCSIS